MVQLLVVAVSVIVTWAVAVPLYVITSRRLRVVVAPSRVMETAMLRTTRPAVG